jgi:hypothetical protein
MPQSTHPTTQFTQALPEVATFVQSLAKQYTSKKGLTWEQTHKKVRTFYNEERMAQVEEVLAGWTQMASYRDGVTLAHVHLVMAGMTLLPEYQRATPEQQNAFMWTALCHDIAKVLPAERYKRDFTHDFRGAGKTARALAKNGFATQEGFDEKIDAWCDLLNHAFVPASDTLPEHADHSQIPAILEGLDALFAPDSQAHHIVTGVLFHMGLPTLKAWLPPVAYTREEIKAYITPERYLYVKAMYLADSWAWAMIHPEQIKPQLWEIRIAFASFAHHNGML